MSKRKPETLKPDPFIVTNGVTEFLPPEYFQVNNAIRGRADRPSPEDLQKLAISIARHGQLSPIQSKPGITETERIPVLGFSRIEAVALLREGFTQDGVEYKNPDQLVWTLTGEVSEQEAFLRNLAENIDRNQTTDYDDALNQKRLREEFGYKDTAIAKVYGEKNTNRVAQLRRVISKVPEDILQEVHKGNLSLYAADNLINLGDDPTVYREVLATTKDPETGKYDGAKIREVIRAKITPPENTTEPATPAKKRTGKKKAVREAVLNRNLSDTRKFFQGIVDIGEGENAEGWSESQVIFAKTFLKWLANERTDKTLAEKFYNANSRG